MATSSKEIGDEYILSLKTVTWQKDSHSLFDYEFNKNVIQNTFEFPLAPKYVYIYRNNTSKAIFYLASEVSFQEHNKLEPSHENHLQLLGCFHLREENKKFRLDFFSSESIKNLEREDLTSSGGSWAQTNREEGVYLIVRSLKNKNNENKGYKLGTTILMQRSDKSSSLVGWNISSLPSITRLSGLERKANPSSG